MKKGLFLLFSGLICFGAFAQKRTIITYGVAAHFGTKDTNALLGNAAAGAEPDSLANSFREAMKELLTTFSQEVNMEAWREGPFVVTRELNAGQGKLYKHYHVDHLDFIVIDSSAYNQSGKVDSTVLSMDYRKDKNWQVAYTVTKTREQKTILNYPCTLYKIEETRKTAVNEKPDIRTFAVWATKDIKPAVSLHAVLGLYQKLLPFLTPLEIEQRSLRAPNSYQRVWARSIK